MHDHPQLRDARQADDSLPFRLDSHVEPFLRHSVELVFFDVVMILGCSYLRCVDFCIIISLGYRSDLLYVPIESFSSYQDRPDALVAILGHIPPFQLWRSPFCYGDDCFLRDLLQSTLLGRGMFSHIDGHNLDDVCQDEPSAKHDLRGLTALPSMTLQ